MSGRRTTMSDYLWLQIRPGADAQTPTLELNSNAAQLAALPQTPFPLPPTVPADATALWAALPSPLQIRLSEFARLPLQRPLALRIDIDARLSYLEDWPWELLTVPGAQPFALALWRPLLRACPPRQPAPPLSPLPLRLLACAAAAPGYAPLAVAPLLAELRALHDPQRIALQTVDDCDRGALEAALREQPDLLILLAHGEPGQLLFADGPLPADDLALLLAGSLSRVAVLIGCHGDEAALDAPSTAATLLQQGLAGVVALRGLVAIPAGKAFLRGFVDGLARGWPLEIAAAAGRRAIFGLPAPERQDWARVLLWQQAAGAHLLPLVQPPEKIWRRAGDQAAKATPGNWAGKLITGGWIALLLAGLLHSVFPLGAAAGIAALLKLLEGLGLNLLASYLGPLLAAETRWAWGRRRERSDIAAALAEVLEAHPAAAAEVAALATGNGALQPTLAAIESRSVHSELLLAKLQQDIERYPAELADFRAWLAHRLDGIDLRLKQGFSAIFGEVRAVKGAVRAVKGDTEQILERLDEGERERRRRLQEQEQAYLQALITSYQRLRLARFIDERQGNEEQAGLLYLQDVYTALTSEQHRLLREDTLPVRRVQRLQRFFAQRRQPDAVPPERVRRLEFAPPPNWQRRGAAELSAGDNALPAELLTLDEGASGWTQAVIGEDVPPDLPLRTRLLRPELIVEAIAPQAGQDATRLVLLGDPGSGKSTVLRYLALLLARARLAGSRLELAGWQDVDPPLPLLLPLGRLADDLEAGMPAEQALHHGLETLLAGGTAPRRALAENLGELLPRTLLLLDGLDELSTEPGAAGGAGPRRQVARAIRHFAGEHPRTPIVVSCRVLPYRARDPRPEAEPWQLPHEEGWQERSVQPFAFGQVQQFIRRWYEADPAVAPDEAAGRSADLMRELEQAPELREAIAAPGEAGRADPPASPLLLTMLSILHANNEGRPLPRQRDELYEALVNLLLHRWEPRRSLPDYQRDDLISRLAIPGLKSVRPLRQVLNEVAFEAHCLPPDARDGRGVINAQQIKGKLAEFFVEVLECSKSETWAKVEIFLDVLQSDAGLLQAQDRHEITLPHLTFQEYLAACHLAGLSERNMLAEAHKRWRSSDGDRWRVALLLLMGVLCQQEKVEGHAAGWLELLCDAHEPDDRPKRAPQRQQDALLALECYRVLDERNMLRGRVASRRREELRAALQALVAAPDPALSAVERAEAGFGLALLGSADAPGDRRTGVCEFPPDWCATVPAGEYEIGSLHNSFENKTYQPRKLHLAEFRIARYPLTVRQYRRFVDAGGYRQQQWWTEQGWQYLRSYKVQQPYRWDNPDLTADNQPVVGVSWYEAVAFCNWLAAEGRAAGWLAADQVIRLPTEAEWEIAAGWDVAAGAAQAWQSPDEAPQQNVRESGIGRPAPVGLFPAGASPGGALDMAGNVWEWCASPYNGYPARGQEQPPDYPPTRIGPALRGGSYYLQNTRSGWGARVRNLPSLQNVYRGFRVLVCSAFPARRF